MRPALGNSVATAGIHFRPLSLSKMKESWIHIGPFWGLWGCSAPPHGQPNSPQAPPPKSRHEPETASEDAVAREWGPFGPETGSGRGAPGPPPRSPGDPREEADEAGWKALPVAAARPHFRPLFLSKMKETWIPIGPLFSFWVPLGPKYTYFLTILKHNATADTIPQQK